VKPFKWSLRSAIAAMAAAGLLCPALSCSSRAVHEKTRRAYPVIAQPDEIKCYTDPVPKEGCKLLALIDSDSETTASVAARERQMKQLRKSASRAGAEAVYGVKVLTRQIHGIVRDASAPKWLPTPTQGWSDEYFLRGYAVLSLARLPKNLPFYGKPAPGGAAPAQDERAGRSVTSPEPEPPSGGAYADPAQPVGAPSWVNLLEAKRHDKE